VHILPPFWRTWWWYSGIILVIISLLILIYKFRIRALKAFQLQLENTVFLRTRDVLEQREVAEKAHRNISLLSEIGRKITASLDINAIFETLYQHISELLNTNTISIGLLNPEQSQLNFELIMIDGIRGQPCKFTLENPDSDQAAPAGFILCVRDKTERQSSNETTVFPFQIAIETLPQAVV